MAPFKLKFRMGSSRSTSQEHEPDPQVNEALLNHQTNATIGASSSTIDSVDCNSLVSLNTSERKLLLPHKGNNMRMGKIYYINWCFLFPNAFFYTSQYNFSCLCEPFPCVCVKRSYTYTYTYLPIHTNEAFKSKLSNKRHEMLYIVFFWIAQRLIMVSRVISKHDDDNIIIIVIVIVIIIIIIFGSSFIWTNVSIILYIIMLVIINCCCVQCGKESSIVITKNKMSLASYTRTQRSRPPQPTI